MANEVENTLSFALPVENKAAFLAAIEGPAYWPVPLDVAYFGFRKPELSNHERLELYRDQETTKKRIEAFLKLDAVAHWPQWMKPSRGDIERFLTAPDKIVSQRSMLSAPKLMPFKDKEEFLRFCPDADPDGPFWVPIPDKRGGNTCNLISLYQSRLGTKRAPFVDELSTEMEVDGVAVISMRFSTAWSPIADLHALLDAVCLEHQAKYLHVWVEEQGFCGYTFYDPANEDSLLTEEWDTDNQWVKEEQDEDAEDEDDVYHRFDHEEFEEDVSGMIDDPHF